MSSISERITLKTVAEAVGVSVAAASMALRNQAGISAPTRKRVQEAAKRLGYKPDPALSALVAYRQDVRRTPVETTVAIVEIHSSAFKISTLEMSEIIQGFNSAAGELGYRLDTFSIGVSLSEQKALFRVLYHRGVRGIIFVFMDVDTGALKADWSAFCAVGIGNSMLHESFPMAILCSDNFNATAECVCELAQRSYRRPLLVTTRHFPARLKREITGGFLAGLHENGISLAKTTLELDFVKEMWREALQKTVTSIKPDVLVSAGRVSGIRSFVDAMKGQALRPDFCALDVFPADEETSGIVQPRESIGRLAVETLHKHLMANIMGPTTQPRFIHIPSIWRDGETIRPRPVG